MPRDSFVFRRVRYDILDRVGLGRKDFLLVRQLSTGPRRRFQAIDPIAGPNGAMRIVQFLPDTAESWQRVGVLQQLSQRNPELPQIEEFHRLRREIASVETWIEGRDLRWWIRSMKQSPRQRLGTPEAMRLFRQLAHAVHHLHRHCGVIHADIKPANIILSNQSRRLTLIDFGSAWGVDRSNRRHPGDGMSEVYTAPELLMGQPGVHFRADYFSLAAVCFEVLTLETPYDGLGGRAGLPQYAAQRDSLLVPPSQLSREQHKLDRDCWQAIDALLTRALKLEPDHRHANGTDWLAEWDSTVTRIHRPEPASVWGRLMLKLHEWLDRR